MSDPNAFDRASQAGDTDWEAAWETEDNYWHENFSSLPYALGPDYYDRFRPAFRYGFESGSHHLGRTWEEAESDLEAGWTRYPRRDQQSPTWDQARNAVRDAWDRARGRRQDDSRGEGR